MAKDKDILAEAKERFGEAQDAWAEVRQAALDDLRFARLGEQWPPDIARQRQLEGRPCLTINRLPTFIRQVVNDARQNKPTIRVRAVDSQADPLTADVFNGIIRHIESASDADVAYDTLADLQNAYDRNMVNSGMAAAAAGAFGGGRQAIREAQSTDDYLRNVAGTSANLRNQGFNTAAGFGMQDADRFLQADTTNVGNSLAASQMNAANALAASQANAANALSAGTFNNNMLNQRQQFDINAANQSEQMRMDALRGMENNFAMQNALTTGNAKDLIDAGHLTAQQLLDLLQRGDVTIGQQADANSTSTTTSKKGGNLLGTLSNIASMAAKSGPVILS